MKLQKLQLNCSNLDELKYFYTQKFNFKKTGETEDSFTMKIGESLLTFNQNRLQNSYYHFAFNIPYGMVDKALRWVKKRVNVIKFEGQEIQEFDSWNARSFYFIDPAQNIVELIGRKPLDYPNHRRFNVNCFQNISEVGLAVENIRSARQSINQIAHAPKFSGNDRNFMAYGNHEGLLIVVDRNDKQWFPTKAKAKSYPMQCEFTEGASAYHLDVESSGRLDIRTA